MAADPTVAERAYGEIKKRLLAGGFHLRQRLDAMAIAQDLGVSTTPVREALVRLSAERLIVNRPAHGFYVALWSEAQLATLYAWRATLAELAAADLSAGEIELKNTPPDYASRVAHVLQALHGEANLELARAAENADDRLHHARRAEAEIWPDAGEEWTGVEQVLIVGPTRARLMALRAYHKKRTSGAAQIRERAILRAMPANGP